MRRGPPRLRCARPLEDCEPPALLSRSTGMSTASLDSSAAASAPFMGSGDLDTQLVLETRNQIRALVDEVRRLSESDVPLPECYDGLLTRVIFALAASG